ncbi:3-oxoacyl-ACP synthase III family protein, partial [Thermodesulfobacteriota bacterium]
QSRRRSFQHQTFGKLTLGVEGGSEHAGLIICFNSFQANRACAIAKMDGRMIFKLATRKLPEVAIESLENAGLTVNDIDLFIPHQANLRINQAFQKAMDLPEKKVFNNIQRYGNTTAATIPIALDEALEMNLIGKGSTVMFIGLGSGLTWGSVIYRFVS